MFSQTKEHSNIRKQHCQVVWLELKLLDCGYNDSILYDVD